MRERIGLMWSETQIPFFYEIVYYYSAIETDVVFVEGFVNHIMNILEHDKSVTGRRVYASYLYYTGKSVEVVKNVIAQGLQVADKHPLSGLGKMERNILNELLRMIGEKENANVNDRY